MEDNRNMCSRARAAAYNSRESARLFVCTSRVLFSFPAINFAVAIVV
jgi:hypothetical protein